MKLRIVTVSLILLSLCGKLFCQDTIFFLNGDVRPCEILHVDSISTTYSYPKKKKIKQREISTTLIYRIYYKDGMSDTLYSAKAEGLLYVTTKEKGLNLLGMYDAKRFYKNPLVTVGGVIFNFGMGFLFYDQMLVATGPLAYTAIFSVTPINFKGSENRENTIASNPHYQEGYLKIARNKRVFNALSGSLLGLIIGITVGNAAN